MNQLVEYTTKNLYGEFKPEEICFVVEIDYDCIDELSYITDKLDDALFKAKENDENKIFIYTKKFVKDCLNTHKIFEYMLENLHEEGLDIGYVIGSVKEYAEKDFTELVEKWFEKFVGNNYWFFGRFLGTLRTEEN